MLRALSSYGLVEFTTHEVPPFSLHWISFQIAAQVLETHSGKPVPGLNMFLNQHQTSLITPMKLIWTMIFVLVEPVSLLGFPGKIYRLSWAQTSGLENPAM